MTSSYPVLQYRAVRRRLSLFRAILGLLVMAATQDRSWMDKLEAHVKKGRRLPTAAIQTVQEFFGQPPKADPAKPELIQIPGAK